ncbi:hypothetical protein CDL12_03835 [Handroanthus impetiginosus]|uniref:BHLH domain-containing protein n=1 Tax=Handroanthus impetiginosus TaxID=429701 RepID=A0A2G9I127_9LAMI|nr:hypothetical protein CDL12_03835 [Handroanthus impetiginosus]
MHNNQPYFPGQPMQPLADQFGYCMQNAPTASVFNEGIMPSGIKPSIPSHTVDIQPSNACPRNFIIFDQTTNRSQIMFHPEMSSKFFYPGFGADTIWGDGIDRKDANDEVKIASSFKEDSGDIDALLSTEDDAEEGDDDEVSTARTHAVYECNSTDSCSNYDSPSGKGRSHFRKSSGSRSNDKKRQRMRKMVKTLKGIVPGANRMSTVAVLDEAIRYLKSLKVEVRKLGVRISKG